MPAKVIALRHDSKNLPEARDDDELMLAAAGGSRAAFAELVRRHIEPLTRFCVKLTGDPESAQEVVQETFVQAWASSQSYVPQGKLGVFLLRVAHNRLRNLRRESSRRERRHQASAPPTLVSVDNHEQLEALLRRERQRRVREALTRLPRKMREALLLRFDQEMDYSDIAEVLGRPEATIRTRVFHGLRRLRAMLEQERAGRR
jgi:RNA polymerase sigma-70 factor (ECF subfamily)